MLEGFEGLRGSIPKGPGAPPTPSSSDLRTLAWMRYLLDHFDKLRAWSNGAPDPPVAWSTEKRAADIPVLKASFDAIRSKAVPSDPKQRTAAILDDTISAVLDSGVSWFTKKLTQLEVRPSEERIARVDDLLPGSARAYYEPPGALDPWFYEAFDFVNPWFGRIFLWRSADPEFADDGWDDILLQRSTIAFTKLIESDSQTLPPDRSYAILRDDVLESRWQHHALDSADIASFASAIDTAAVHATYEIERDDPHGLVNAAALMHTALAASSSDTSAPNPITRRLQAMSLRQALLQVSNAIAAYRLGRGLSLPNRHVAAWWLKGALDGVRERIDRAQWDWFYTMPKGEPPLEGALRKRGLWEPSDG